MGFGGPKYEPPPPVPMPPPAAHPATLGSAIAARAPATAVSAGGKAAGVMTQDNTIATSPQGVSTKSDTAKATLLGQ